jgi:flagellar motility protein MotE (MotC chaperone)
MTCNECKEEIKRLRRANENNLEGWSQDVTGLNRKIARLEKELEEKTKHLINSRQAYTKALLRDDEENVNEM